ncbi:hypothetical protein [Streptomyces sp. NPDC001903]|uniref:hypothetical protein n=1 Tax=Streptomyces sp. NPDC001903 TaxID=3364622 RepID=UPI0036B244D5
MAWAAVTVGPPTTLLLLGRQKFPLLASIHAQMFKIASQVVAWYAVDFRDYDLQMPTGRPTH